MTHDLLPPRIRRGLAQFGCDIRDARRRRRLTAESMAERVGVSKVTYLKVEKGDPRVAMGTYAMTLFVLGLGNPLENLADIRDDDTGLLLDRERLPERVRTKRRR